MRFSARMEDLVTRTDTEVILSGFRSEATNDVISGFHPLTAAGGDFECKRLTAQKIFFLFI
jgi:hypothetical protein